MHHDCDDYNDPQRFEKRIAFLEERTDISVLGANVGLFGENGVWGEQKFPRLVSDKDFLFTSPYKHGSVVFWHDAVEKMNGYGVSKKTYCTENYDLFISLQMFCKGADLQEKLYFFCEDRAAWKRRKYHYRVDEAKVRYNGFKTLGLLPKGLPYVVKPLIVGLIPVIMLDKMKDSFYGRK